MERKGESCSTKHLPGGISMLRVWELSWLVGHQAGVELLRGDGKKSTHWNLE